MAHTHFYHPGIILRDHYLAGCGITQRQLANAIDIPQSRISELCNGKRDIDADMALRLGKFFGIDARTFAGMQTHYDLAEAAAEQKARHVRIRPFKMQLAQA